MNRRSRGVALGVLAALFLSGCLVGCAPSERTAGASSSPRTSAPLPGFTAISYGELPPEGRATYDLITRGGPYPHRQDGTTFGNRERLLPLRGRGYYREFTVPTPGAATRGAKRIIAGDGGERFYTADHYRTFLQIIR